MEMADEPPPYEEAHEGHEGSGSKSNDWSADFKTPQRINIRDEVGASRSQHVAALAAKLLPQVRWRAKHGLSKMTFLMMTSDHGELDRIKLPTP